jgi:hypothetical protein
MRVIIERFKFETVQSFTYTYLGPLTDVNNDISEASEEGLGSKWAVVPMMTTMMKCV